MCGGIIGLSLFGPKSIDAFLLPIAADYWNLWEKELLERKTKPSPQRDLDMRQCQQALLVSLNSLIYKHRVIVSKPMQFLAP